MDFALTFETSLKKDKLLILNNLSNDLQNYFSAKKYGLDIQHYYIGFIIVTLEVEEFFQVRKPKYKSISKVKLLDETVEELKGVFSYDIKLNFVEFECLQEEECKRVLATEILKSLFHLNALSKKLNDFDIERFKFDVEKFFKENSLV